MRDKMNMSKANRNATRKTTGFLRSSKGTVFTEIDDLHKYPQFFDGRRVILEGNIVTPYNTTPFDSRMGIKMNLVAPSHLVVSLILDSINLHEDKLTETLIDMNGARMQVVGVMGRGKDYLKISVEDYKLFRKTREKE